MSIFKRNKDAIYIELKPRVDKNYWGGDVELNIICNPESKLDEDSRIALLHLAQLVSCAIPVMPGMKVSGKFRVGKRKLITYFIYPLIRTLGNSFAEP